MNLHIFCLVRFSELFRALEVDLESLGADLKAVHGLDGGHRAHRVVVRHEPLIERGKKWTQLIGRQNMSESKYLLE